MPRLRITTLFSLLVSTLLFVGLYLADGDQEPSSVSSRKSRSAAGRVTGDGIPAGEPWKRFEPPQPPRHDALLRRDFDSESDKQVPIKRKYDALQHTELSPSFKRIYAKIYQDRLQTDLNFQFEYEQHLDRLLTEDKLAGCGDWPAKYTELHRSIRASYNDTDAFGRKPAHVRERGKRLVAGCAKSRGQCGGLGDRLLGHISTFMLSLVLDRAFIQYWSPDYPLLAEDCFISPHINWAWPMPRDEVNRSAIVPPEHPAVKNGYYLFVETTTEWLDEHLQRVSREHLDETELPLETTLVHGNKGLIVRQLLHDDTWQAQKLWQGGFTTENAYRCAINFLFEPLPWTRLRIAQYQALIDHPFIFTTAVQIRTGDTGFLNPELDDDLDRFRYYIECAADAAAAFAIEGVHTHWVLYLSTDQSKLARMVEENVKQFLQPGWTHPLGLEPMVLTTGLTPLHLEKGDDLEGLGQGKLNTFDEQKRHMAMQSSILSNYVLDVADRRLMTQWSGYGLLSQLRSWKGATGAPMPAIWTPGERPPNRTVDDLLCSDPAAYWTLEDWAFGGYKMA